ncbi:MAG: hypothetical protein JXR60_07550 [Bacteroidales bacterium]|nr:hypothetical protein [Bacteroidales bacterium]
MKAFQIIVFVTLAATLLSCQKEGLEGQLSKAKTEAENNFKQISKMDWTVVKEKQKIAQEIIGELKPNFDLLNKYDRQNFSVLANTEKADKKFHPDLDKLEKNYVFSIRQIKALETALAKQEMPKDSIEKYLNDELKVLQELNQRLAVCQNQFHYLNSNYDEFTDKCKVVADSLNQLP